MKTTSQFIPMFKIFKKGITSKPVTILKKRGEPFDEKAKRAKYIWLGYTITEIN